MNKCQITPDLLNALIQWQAGGMRHVKIEMDGLQADNPCTVWVYDYKFTAGEYVTCRDNIPSTEELLRKQQASVEDQRQRLIDQLKTLEVQL